VQPYRRHLVEPCPSPTSPEEQVAGCGRAVDSPPTAPSRHRSPDSNQAVSCPLQNVGRDRGEATKRPAGVAGSMPPPAAPLWTKVDREGGSLAVDRGRRWRPPPAPLSCLDQLGLVGSQRALDRSPAECPIMCHKKWHGLCYFFPAGISVSGLGNANAAPAIIAAGRRFPFGTPPIPVSLS
jgi:hypothetical protein